MAIGGRDFLWDAKRKPPGSFKKTHRVKDGTKFRTIVEKLPPGRSEKWVSQNGDVKRVKLTGGDFRPDPQFEAWQRFMQRRSGAIPYRVCPLLDHPATLTASDFPEELQHPCQMYKMTEDGRQVPVYSDEHCCPHVDYVIQERQAAVKEANDELDRVRRAAELREERRLEILERGQQVQADTAAKTAELLHQLTEAAAGKKKQK